MREGWGGEDKEAIIGVERVGRWGRERGELKGAWKGMDE